MKRKLLIFTIIAALILPTFGMYGYAEENIWREYYVSLDGDDSNDGITAPFKTIQHAIEEVSKVSDEMTGDIIVNIASGVYHLDDMLRFHPEDSGKNGHRVVYRGIDRPVISGGITAEGFVKSQKYENLWELKLDGVDTVTDLYIDGKRAYMANSNRRITALGEYNDPNTSQNKDGLYVSSSDISMYENAERIWLGFPIEWNFMTARVSKIEKDPESTDRYILRMEQPYWNSYFDYWNQVPGAKDSFFVMNAFELLDVPGEYYFNEKEHKLYYFPREGEDMTKAKADIPQMDILMTITGNGIENQVKNISFEGLDFRYAKNTSIGEMAMYSSKQGQNVPDAVQSVHLNKSILVGAIELNHTNGITFEDNSFVGLGSVGIYMIEGAFNTTIKGNAFSDIGDTAIGVGHTAHSDGTIGRDGVDDPPPENAKLDLANMAIIDSSNVLTANTMVFHFTGTGLYTWGAKKFITEEEFNHINTEVPYLSNWNSDTKSDDPQYVRYDFLDYYSVDKIMVAFNPSIAKEKRSEFKILLSNDPDFKDESTIVAVDQIDPAEIKNTYEIDTDQKFRYAMLRVEPKKEFSVTRIAFLTDDIEPYTDIVRCNGVDIENNYFTRIATGNGVVGSGAAICSYGYEEGIRIKHNEITDLGYAAIQIGYGWRKWLLGNRNNYIGYNYFENICQELPDGGAIYTIADQEGFLAERNYIEGLASSYGAIYADQGSANMLIRDNVVVDVGRTNFSNNGTESVVFENTFSTSSVNIDYGLSNNVLEEIRMMKFGDLPEEAAQIKAEAGIEKEYKHIKSYVPDIPINVTEERQSLTDYTHAESLTTADADAAAKAVSEVLEGEFGILFGQYPDSVKAKLTEYKPYANASGDKVKAVDLRVGVKDYLRELSVRRYDSFDEMLSFCETEIDKETKRCVAENDKAAAKNKKTSYGTFTKKAIDEFSAKVSEVKTNVAEKTLTEVAAIYKLEAAYNEFYGSRLGGGIESAYINGMIKSEIDMDANTVTFFVRPDDNLKAKTLELRALGRSSLARVLKKQYDLTSDVKIPVYCPALKTYTYWTIKTKEYTENSGKYVQAFSNEDIIKEITEGEFLLQPRMTAYMKEEYKGTSGKLDFKPVCVNDESKFTIIIGAGAASDFVYNGSESYNDRLELVLSDSKAELYSVVSGKRKKASESAVSFTPNKWNSLTYKAYKEGNVDRFKVYLNNTLSIDAAVPVGMTEGYSGIYTTDIAIRVK